MWLRGAGPTKASCFAHRPNDGVTTCRIDAIMAGTDVISMRILRAENIFRCVSLVRHVIRPLFYAQEKSLHQHS